MIRITRILVTEHEKTLREMYAAVLKEDGYDVLIARDCAEALAMNEIHHPDIVVMDPAEESRGIEIACEFTRTNRRVQVVFNTGDSYGIGRDFAAWVADAVAEKGADASQLRSTLRVLAGGPHTRVGRQPR